MAKPPVDEMDQAPRGTKPPAVKAPTTSSRSYGNGVNTTVSDTQIAKGGIEGTFGGKQDGIQYEANHVDVSNAAGQAAVAKRMADVSMQSNIKMDKLRPVKTAQANAAQATAASLDTAAADQTRSRQNALLDSLQGTISGTAPSAANATLQSATDRNLAASLAQAAAAGGSPAAMRSAAFQRAQITQDAAGQSAALRANEIATAQGQLGQAAQGVRGQDLQVAGQNADMAQQTGQTNAQLQQQTALANQGAINQGAQFNASLAQDTNKTNMLSEVEQQKQKNEMVTQLMLTGLTLEQASQQAEIQQRQFNTSNLTQQEAARQGVSAQNTASASATGTGIISGLASLGAAVSDERQKKKVKDGDSVVEKYLDDVPKTFAAGKRGASGRSPSGIEVEDKQAKTASAGMKGFSAAMGAASSENSRLAQSAGNERQVSQMERSAEEAKGRLKPVQLSDKREKKNVEKGDDGVGAFLDSLHAKEYEYKDPDMAGAGHGRRVGIMAQDMEKTPVGKEAVIERDGTKMIDMNKSVSAALAGLANINKRLRELEHA